nr:PREDICTED: vitellogenin receptor-like [Linepithema humile]
MVDQSSYDNTDSNASYFSFRVEHSLSQVGFFSAALIGSCFCFRTKYKACESFFVLQLLITTFGFIAPAMFPGLIVGSATLHTFYIRKKMEMRHRPISQIMCRIAYLLLVCSFLWVSGVEGMFQSVDLYDAFTDEFGNEDYSYYEGSCPKNKFQCTTGSIRCVSNLHQCDVVSDCDDDSDEENCHMGNHVTCANDEFSCQNKKECIPEHKFCDEVFDCTDHSDELVDCQEHRIKLQNPSVACDSKDNCGDYSDEGGNCTNTTLCSSVKCQYCKSTPTGPVCFCPPGYKLQENNTCTDIDECQTYGICDQGCENLLGSYNCFCHPNYLLQDNNKTCKYNGAATLVFSTRKNIFLFNPDTEYYTGIMVRNLDHIVDAVINDGYFYWSEVKENENSVIKRVSFDKTREKHETIVTEGLHRVTSLDVDWITGNIYFTDSGYFRIGACNNKGTHCTVLINTDSMLPKLLVLLPTKGLMYYYQEQISIDNEYISKQIKMAGMDGKNMTTFVEPELHVDGLAVDYPSNRLYWLSENGMIESIKLDGTDKRDILHSTVEHAISLAVFENKLYWSDWESKTIQTCDKFSGKDWKTLSHTIEESYRIHIDYPVMKLKFSDPCSPNPCSQLCLLNRNESYTCACSIGQKLNADRHTCLDVKEKPHLVIIAGNTFINYYYELLGKPNVTTNTVSKEISVTEAVYDQLTGTILAIDQYNHYVIRYDPKDGNITNLISIKDMIVGGMAFDYIGNNVYLSNLKHRSIEVHSLTTRKKTIFYFEDEPHSMEIMPTKGCDGHKDCPNGEDEESNCKERGICEEDEFMCDDHTCINEDKHCDFFTDCVDDSDEKHCFKIQCNKGEYRCRRGGECISRFAVCDGNYDCPDFSDELHCDNYTCSSDEFMCDMGKCIPKDWKCDDEFDCPDGSDEAGHCYLKSICGPDYYKCANGRCISNSLQCNHINDCGDDSDEKYCTRYGYSRNCTENEYLCMNSGICVSKKAKCNGIQDCPRNDDEFYCAYCFEDEFTCDNQKCIGKHLVCNNVDDCGDNSEETDCRNNKKNIENCDQFKCTSGTCLSFDKVCDGINDCPDGSDEYGNCSLACQNAKCEDMCQNRPHGAVCSCRPGYSLDSNGKSCNDINECLQNVCSQNCLNTVGSYICECLSIYSLRTDKVSCKAIGPQMHFITTTGDDIRNISADVGSVELVHHLAGFSISSIDSNALDDALYWSSEEEGTINKMNVKTKKILTMGNFTPKAIAVDWVTNNVYFNDNNRRNVIKVCNLEQLKCAVIVEIKDMAKVTALAVDPILGYLFWSHTTWHSHDKPIAEIYRTNLMGADMKKIVFRNISVVSGMAIDQLKFKLYWSDSYFKTIESANYEGDGRTTFLNTDICRPASINIFEDSIYWLMASTGQLQKCKLYGDKACTTIDIGTHNIHRHFTIFHTVNHPNVVENFCKIEHCDYMCVLNHSIIDLLDEHIESFVTCICQDGKPVKPNTICPKNANEDIAFVSTHTCHNGGICSIIIIMILIVGALFGVYYLYQKYKLKLGVLDLNIINSFDRIRFQNPLFDRRDEVTVNTVTFNSTASSNIFPGQHEYMNPVTEELSEKSGDREMKKSLEALLLVVVSKDSLCKKSA